MGNLPLAGATHCFVQTLGALLHTLLYRPASYLAPHVRRPGVFQVVSTGLSSPAPPTATAACLDTCRLQLVRKNAFQITASVSSSQALLAQPLSLSLTHSHTHTHSSPSLSLTPWRRLCVLGGRLLEWSPAQPSVYLRSLLNRS